MAIRTVKSVRNGVLAIGLAAILGVSGFGPGNAEAGDAEPTDPSQCQAQFRAAALEADQPCNQKLSRFVRLTPGRNAQAEVQQADQEGPSVSKSEFRLGTSFTASRR